MTEPRDPIHSWHEDNDERPDRPEPPAPDEVVCTRAAHHDWSRHRHHGADNADRPEPSLNVLWLAIAIDGHTLAYGPTEPIHDEGTCSSDCAGDIRARYEAERVRTQPTNPDPYPFKNEDGH